MRLLPKVQGNLLTFFGYCIRPRDSWEQYKAHVLKEYFPLFVRKKMIRKLVVFHFQERGCPLREFTKEVVDAAKLLQYHATEGETLDRILMNLHPDILAQAAFLPRPAPYRQLRDMVCLIEKKMAVMAERQRLDMGLSSSQMVERGGVSDNKPGRVAVDSKQYSKNRPTRWRCGKQGHVQRNCKGHNSSSALAAIAPNGEPPVRVLGRKDVEANAHREEETTQTNSQLKSGTRDSTGGKKRPHCPRRGHHQRGRKKQMKGGGDPPTNPPLWV